MSNLSFKDSFTLNEDFKYVLQILEQTRKNVFITGKAGTGKSTLLQYFRQHTRKKVAVLAPTGIAALNVYGQTLHSFFGFPPKIISHKDIKQSYRRRKLVQMLDILVIDEISMVRADMLDNIDYFLRMNGRNPHEPFGGVQMAFFGDLFQLPPVVRGEEVAILERLGYSSPYFFAAQVWERAQFQTIELQQVFRQEQRHFLRLLEAVRLNRAEWDELETLNGRYAPDAAPLDEGYITLASTNATVDAMNKQRLEQLSAHEYLFTAKIKGSFPESAYPTDPILRLKVGAQVMFLKNDAEQRYANGTLGLVAHLDAEKIVVKVERANGEREEVMVEQVNWEMLKYDVNDKGELVSEAMGTFQHYPLRLAWAVTIHKSQGKTFDKVVIDLGRGAFEHGQTYVALSRCRTLEGIVLKSPIRPRDIITDERVVSFYESMR